MSDPAVEAVKQVLTNQYNKVKTMEENNKEVKEKLLSKIKETLENIEGLEDQRYITDEAKNRYSGLIETSKMQLINLKSQTNRLLTLVESMSTNEGDLSFLDVTLFPLEIVKREYNSENIANMPDDLVSQMSIVQAVHYYIADYKKHSDNLKILLNKNISDMLKEAEEELKDFKITKNILKNAKTDAFYTEAAEKFFTKSKNNRNIFICILISSLFFAISSVISKPIFFLDKFDYWFLKVSYILVSLTLITYFLKQSTHYQRLGDQANQTSLEIKAFPTFISSDSKENEAAIRKELALKYFGREIDGAAHKDMSNLISDQMKSTTEMVKAATNVLKAKGP